MNIVCHQIIAKRIAEIRISRNIGKYIKSRIDLGSSFLYAMGNIMIPKCFPVVSICRSNIRISLRIQICIEDLL